MKHFELTAETRVTPCGVTLFRIKATTDIELLCVKKGDLGGFVEKESNLSGDAWIYGNAEVYGDARIDGNAEVYGNARIYGNAEVYGNARIYGNAEVYGNARIYGNAWIYGNAEVYGNAWIYGDARIYGNAWIYGDARVSLQSEICLFSNFGSRNSTTIAYKTKRGFEITCGCFRGDINSFISKIKETHGDSKIAKEYLAICEVIKIRFAH